MGARLMEALRKLWRVVRRVSGDDGYERYLAHRAAAHPDVPALPRRAWFALQQQQKWSGIKRCC
ncbi:MAG: YbdD/YjiX family protein [Gallionella sp.]|nr:YbdD/YjiX family protein [Gallionella sp.]